MSGPYDDIARRLRLVIAASETSQTQFARTLGISPNNVTNWLSGNYRVGLDHALLIREAHGVPLDWLYCGGSVDKLPSKIAKMLSGTPRDTHSQ